MSLFNRRFTPAYDILQAKKRAGAPSFVELDRNRLLPTDGQVGQVVGKDANGKAVWLNKAEVAHTHTKAQIEEFGNHTHNKEQIIGLPPIPAFNIFNGF